MHDLPHYIRTYDNDLDAELCQRLISSFTALQRFQNVNGRGVRAGLEDSAWTELNVTRLSDTGFLGVFRGLIDRALDRYNADVGLHIPIPNSPLTSDLVMKRYRPGGLEKFQLHFDAVNHVAHRYLVLMWYLNDVAVGGETRFPQIGSVIAARAGRLLVFPPYWMYQHEGAPPSSGDKYILSTYLLFKQPQAS
ncbi:MAG TPA: 2OG-Fe(II) oxygenase [Steroidobacteraceae bacterium]|nr:2OG-Fe(II) oxygenase [Steroidobacteraceae bacterium]